MKLNPFCFLLLSFFVCNSANAQVPFISNSFSTDSLEYANAFCETPLQQYFFAGERVNKDSSGFIFLTDKLGNVKHSRFVASNSFIYISHCISNADYSINIYGYKFNYFDSISYFFYCKVDTSLNIIDVKDDIKIDTAMRKSYSFNFYSTSINNRIYSFTNYEINEIDSSVAGYTTHKVKFRLIKQKLNADTLFSIKAPNAEPSPIMKGANPFTLTIATQGVYIMRLDTNFNTLDSMPCLQRNIGEPTTMKDTLLFGINSNHLEVNPNVFLVGTRLFHYDVVRYAWGLNKYDMNTKTLIKRNSFPYIIEDPTSLQSSPNSIIKHNNKVYFSGANTLFENKIAVGRFDTSGKPEWIKYFKNGTLPVRSYGLFGCSDGGIIVLGYDQFSSGVGKPRGDFYIFKLDENGNPLSIRNISEQLRNGISIYPNPASDKINIKGASIGSQILFYNMNGKLVLKEKITSNNNPIYIDYLPAANYSYQIINSDGQKISSGVCIKP